MTSKRRRIAAMAVVLACTSGALAACGDDDEATATTTTAAADQPGATTTTAGDGEAASGAFCDAYLAVSAAMGGPVTDPEAVTAQIDAVEAEAPEAVAEEVAVVVEAARSVMASNGEDFSAFEEPEFAEAQSAVGTTVYDSCEFDTKLDVVGMDYSFGGLPETLEAGSLAIMFTNEGDEAHEIGIARINDGVTESVQEILELPEEEAMTRIEQIGGAFAPTKGSSSLLTAELEPGNYVALCFIPVGTTTETEGDGPPHFVEGMITEFTVTA